jgi:hypothetical protein
MNLIIPLLLFIQINLTFLTEKSTNKEKKPKIFSQTKKAKALVCSVLSSSPISTEKNTKRQIRELLKKNEIIKRTAETKEKIYEFLTAICFKNIKDETANDILNALSEKKAEVLTNRELVELFEISPNLDYKNIQKLMDTVNEILDQIEEEEEKSGLFNDENFSYMKKKKNKNNNNQSNFDFRNIFKDIKQYIQDFEIETETMYSILLSLIMIILSFLICFYRIKYEENQNNNKIKDNDGKE